MLNNNNSLFAVIHFGILKKAGKIMTYLLENYDIIVLRKRFKGQIVNRMIATLVNISKKFILNNHIVHKYRYKIDIKIYIIKSMNIYNIYNNGFIKQ